MAASHVFVIVSDHSAAEFAAASVMFSQNPSTANIVARTPRQLEEIEDLELRELISQADIVVAVGVFDPTVERLIPLFQESRIVSTSELLAFNGDYRLVMLSHARGEERFFKNSAEVLTLGKQQPPADMEKWLQELSDIYPRHRRWIKARLFWQARGSENIFRLLKWLTTDDALGDRIVPKMQKTLRFMQYGNLLENNAGYPHSSSVFIVDHIRGDKAGDRDLSGQLCLEFEKLKHNCVVGGVGRSQCRRS